MHNKQKKNYQRCTWIHIDTHTSIASTVFWQGPLGTQVHVCVSITLLLGDTFSTNCQKWSFFSRCVCIWHLVVGQLQLFYTNFDSTEKLCYSFGRGISLCTAAPKDKKNDNDQLLLEEVFLDQPHWCSSICGFTKQVSAAGSRYKQIFLGCSNGCRISRMTKGFFFFFVFLPITGLWLQKVSNGFSMLRHKWCVVVVTLVNLMEPESLVANAAARPLSSLIDWNLYCLLRFRK